MILSKLRRPAELLSSKGFIPICLIALYFLFLAIFVSLSGNFPLNDDWSYGEGVRNFLDHGTLVIPMACAVGFTHVLIGAFFCKIFGFSYVVLRTTVLAIGFIGSLAFYGSLRQLGIQRNTATFCALLYTVNPLMVNLYFTFMSDVTALSLLNLYVFLLLRAVKSNSSRTSLLIAICSVIVFVLAMFTRQSAIILAPCSLCLFLLPIKKRRQLYGIVIVSLLIPVLAYITADHWLIHRAFGTRDYMAVKEGHILFLKNVIFSPLQCLYHFIVASGQTACYLALFTCPILISFVLKGKGILAKYLPSLWLSILLATTTALVSAKELVISQAKLMPFNQNLLRLPMVCALTIMGLNMPLLPPRRLKWLTAISFFLAWILLTIVFSLVAYLFTAYRKFLQGKSITKQRLAILWVCTISLFITLTFSGIETVVRCTDRYYLIALAPLILNLAIMSRWLRLKLVQPLAILLLALIAFYSAAAAQDYMGWNRARWTELQRLEARGISSSQIDGGCEYNILRDVKIYESTYHGEPPCNKWRWWTIKGEKYIISFSPIPNYKIIDRLSYWSALTFSNLEVLVLERENSK